MSSFGNSCSVSPRAWKCKEELCCQRRHLVCTFVDNVLFHFREQQGSCFPKKTADKNILFADKNNVFDPHWWQGCLFLFSIYHKNMVVSAAAQLLPLLCSAATTYPSAYTSQTPSKHLGQAPTLFLLLLLSEAVQAV